jgi:hypothetical protein
MNHSPARPRLARLSGPAALLLLFACGGQAADGDAAPADARACGCGTGTRGAATQGDFEGVIHVATFDEGESTPGVLRIKGTRWRFETEMEGERAAIVRGSDGRVFSISDSERQYAWFPDVAGEDEPAAVRGDRRIGNSRRLRVPVLPAARPERAAGRRPRMRDDGPRFRRHGTRRCRRATRRRSAPPAVPRWLHDPEVARCPGRAGVRGHARRTHRRPPTTCSNRPPATRSWAGFRRGPGGEGAGGRVVLAFYAAPARFGLSTTFVSRPTAPIRRDARTTPGCPRRYRARRFRSTPSSTCPRRS